MNVRGDRRGRRIISMVVPARILPHQLKISLYVRVLKSSDCDMAVLLRAYNRFRAHAMCFIDKSKETFKEPVSGFGTIPSCALHSQLLTKGKQDIFQRPHYPLLEVLLVVCDIKTIVMVLVSMFVCFEANILG